MRTYLWLAVLLAVATTTCVKAKPLVSFGVSYQQPYVAPQPGPYYYGGPYQGAGYYPGPYGYPYPYANRYGALDVGIGALSLSSFLL
ncbi:uncharacterized protein LOC108034770 [Drosophila biarmipes]|uniref:uncharacterized protein LOC108034770 n=1 Tax=Drosophila biarmipes TaxID=125945 RepID=UPI0007E76CFC|nr:uncharacterized protein LOC108034770 [Drosophila biarmipes]